MKKLLSLAVSAALIFVLSTCGQMAPQPEPDYIGMMLRAVCTGDMEAGREAESLLAESRIVETAEVCPLSFDELYSLSRAISCRFGGSHYSDELRLCMGEMLLNRVGSAKYPDTLEQVIESAMEEGTIEPGHYENCTNPDWPSASAALRLLQGERMMESSVVEMSNERREDYYSMFCSTIWGNTYFYSENEQKTG